MDDIFVMCRLVLFMCGKPTWGWTMEYRTCEFSWYPNDIPLPGEPTMNLLVDERTGKPSKTLSHLPVPGEPPPDPARIQPGFGFGARDTLLFCWMVVSIAILLFVAFRYGPWRVD